jgi:hypothetical protein
MAIELKENLPLSTISESSGMTKRKKRRWEAKVIESGWGSSGYYGASMLAEFGPKVFKAGTKVFMNHPSASEASDRPERDVHQLAGKLVSDAVFRESGLYAEIEFYSHYAPIIEEMADDVGLSIHALGNAVEGEAEGRQGPIIESLVEDPFTSVDVVTVAGAGGKFVALLESYKRIGEAAEFVAEADTEGNGMSITKEEFDAAIADLKETFVETLSPLRESVSVLVEAATPAETEATEEVEAEVADALDPVEVAEKFNESGLPKVALSRVAEALKSESNTKSVDELITEEKAYADAIRADVAAAEETVGSVHEAKTTSFADEFSAITSRIAGARK